MALHDRSFSWYLKKQGVLEIRVQNPMVGIF
jgi:hypothetical protein